MSKADKLGVSASFGQARPVSARRAAIGRATEAPTAGVPDPTELPVGLISQNPDNPREELRDIDSMTQSVKELGVINAITVATVDAYLRERPTRSEDLDDGAKYLVVDGHRRLEAARRAGLETIKVQVDNDRVATDEALLEAAFVSNFHRDDMTDLEQAHALESLVRFYGGQTKASKRLGLAQATISSKLSLLKLSPELQADLASGKRQVEHVRNLGKLSPEEQREAADARLAEAMQRAEQRATQESPAAGDQASGDYHDVIIGGGEPGSQPGSEPTARHKKDGRTETVGTQAPAHGATGPSRRRHPKPDQGAETAAAIPWNDPQAVVRIAKEQMTLEDFRIAAKLWQQQSEID